MKDATFDTFCQDVAISLQSNKTFQLHFNFSKKKGKKNENIFKGHSVFTKSSYNWFGSDNVNSAERLETRQSSSLFFGSVYLTAIQHGASWHPSELYLSWLAPFPGIHENSSSSSSQRASYCDGPVSNLECWWVKELISKEPSEGEASVSHVLRCGRLVVVLLKIKTGRVLCPEMGSRSLNLLNTVVVHHLV